MRSKKELLEIREYAMMKKESIQDMCNSYILLDRLGVFNAGGRYGAKWWKRYEHEMMYDLKDVTGEGLTWDECYKNFPLIIKFLVDISKGYEGHEAFEPAEELCYFEGILYEDCGSVGLNMEDKTSESWKTLGLSKRAKFVQCIIEMCGLAIVPTKGFQKMYALVGKGQDGKSVLLNFFDSVMNGTINGNLCGHTPIDELGDKFALQSLVSQVCNISDDINTRPIRNTGIIKTLIGAGGLGTGITVCRKNMEDFFWNDPQILLIIAGNCLPNFEDTTKGMMRRVIYIPFKNSLADEEVDIDLSRKIKLHWGNLDMLFYMGRVAITQAKKRGHLTELKESDDIKKRYVDSRKSEIEQFKDWIEAETMLTFDEWVLGLEGARQVSGMDEEIAKHGGYGNKTTDDVWYKYLEFKEIGMADDTSDTLDAKAKDSGVSRVAFIKKLESIMDVTIKTTRTTKRIGGKNIMIRYYYR